MAIPTVFVDSDAFVALAKSDDANHQKAIKVFEKLVRLEANFLTSNYVVAETTTVISKKVSHHAAVSFLDQVKAPTSDITIFQITPEVDYQTGEIFAKQMSRNVSFIDCSNITLIKNLKLNAIFSFDLIYKKNGLLLASGLA